MAFFVAALFAFLVKLFLALLLALLVTLGVSFGVSTIIGVFGGRSRRWRGYVIRRRIGIRLINIGRVTITGRIIGIRIIRIGARKEGL
jgi:hypothetical protein